MVIGLDCSTTGVKALAVNAGGIVEHIAKSSLFVYSPQPGYYEQDADDWWKGARTVLKKISRQVGPERIKAVSITNQRETFVPLDENGRILRKAILWLDERCRSEVEPFSKKIGKRKIHRITGKPVDYAPVVFRLAWMQNHETEIFNKTYKFCDVHTYLTWKLTNSYSTSWASADPMGLFDIGKKKWSADIMNALNLSMDQLPDVYRTTSVLGYVSNKAAKQTGLSQKTLVVAGGGDGQAAGLGSNALTSQRAYLNLGTAVVTGVYSRKLKTSNTFRTMIAASENGYIFESSLRAGTLAISWFIKSILNINPSDQPSIYNDLRREAEQVPPGSSGLLFLPYLNGVMNPYWDVDARGAFVGLASYHTRGHMYRAILEGIAFETLLAIKAIERTIGKQITELVAIGGGASNKLWCRIFADVLGKNICIPQYAEASGMGAAVIAMVGAGWYDNTIKAANIIAGIKEKIEPDFTHNKIYKRIYRTYTKIYRQLKTVN